MRDLSAVETKNVSGGNSGKDLAQMSGSIAGGAIGGRLAGPAGATGGAAMGGFVAGQAYDAASNAINSSPRITIPAISYDPATLGRPAYLSGPDNYYICRMTGRHNCS